jgi:putative membrane protein
MRLGVILAALLGLVLAAYFVVSVGLRPILSAVLAVGWGGFAMLCLFGTALFALLGTAWFALIPRHEKPRLANFVWSRAVRECASELLPFSQFGGIVIGARALMLRRVNASLAFASTIVDVTVEMVAQIVFVLAGLAIVLASSSRAHTSAWLTRSVAVGVVGGAIAAALFLLFQQRGLGALAHWGGRYFPKAGAWLGTVNHCLAEIRASSSGLVVCFVIHICGWVGTALWGWIALSFMGRPVSFLLVFAIEAILYGIRSAAIFIPGAIGVQEASYALIGPLFGIAPATGIALSLLKRARDLALGVPVLLAWQFAEGGRALKATHDPVQLTGEKRSP